MTYHTPKSVIVTGSSSGIGRDVARAFLERGDRVVVHGRDEARLTEVARSLAAETGAPEGHIVAVLGDMSDVATGERLVRAAVERFGRVDVLVNNAGTFEATPFVDVTEEQLNSYLHGNLKGTYFISQAAVRQMKRDGGGGSIVNIGTVLIDHPIGGVPASAPLVSKGGVHALTKSLAAELAADDIRVNLVAPGMVRTPLHSGDVDALGGVALMNRVGETAEIADAVLYLADASFTTGHILNVDGGFVAGRA